MTEPPLPFQTARFEALLRSSSTSLGRPLHYQAVTGSTNSDLLELARRGAPHGTVCVADHQTHGRGRHGNSWSSPRTAENLLFSVLLRPRLRLETASSFTLAVGLSLRDALAQTVNVPLGIKWTNDLYASGRKLAGILVESQIQGSELSALVVGIGLNVHMTELPEEIATIATSLRLLGAVRLEREALLVQILQALEARMLAYEQTHIEGIIEELRACDAIRGKPVRVGEKTGIARGLDDDGALLLEREPGAPLERQTTGLVEVLSRA